ncbi:MAG TPA: hypothetical protein VFX65_14105, partial [Candidatus Limnocylindrales bacterium]|nr:hypothetical protein [Candidatus Limnocylindrales bacterium]
MRKFLTLPVAGLLVLAVAAPVLAGPNTSNTSGSGEVISGELAVDGSYGYFMVFQENNEPGYGDLYLESGAWVECPPPAEGSASIESRDVTADDTGPGEGVYGFVGTRTYGWAFDVEISLSRRLDIGTATGSIELYTETVDECAGTFGEPTFEIVALSVSAAGQGDVVS